MRWQTRGDINDNFCLGANVRPRNEESRLAGWKHLLRTIGTLGRISVVRLRFVAFVRLVFLISILAHSLRFRLLHGGGCGHNLRRNLPLSMRVYDCK